MYQNVCERARTNNKILESLIVNCTIIVTIECIPSNKNDEGNKKKKK